MKKDGSTANRTSEKLYSRFVLGKVCENQSFSLYNRENTRTWEIIKAVPVKSDTGEIHAYFQPLSLHFFERMDS